ncbi:MAG: DUF302 domain-containing protein [Chloroflexota bacterium]
MKTLQSVGLALLVLLFMSGCVLLEEPPQNGLVTVESTISGEDSVQQTVDQLVTNLEAKGLTVMAVVNHGENAANVELELPPTQLIIFGNPNLGTQLMNNSQSVAIDLPQKYLVWADPSSGKTFVSYNGVPYLVNRHGLTGPDEVLNTVTGALANFANSVAESKQSRLLPEIGIDQEKVVSTLLFARTAHAQESNGLVVVDGACSVDETVAVLESTIAERGLNVMAIVNHTANAAKVERELRPTQVILFGNPRVGTPLMQASRTVGIDLPQKMLVWEDEAGDVHLAYNDPHYLQDRHDITERDEVLTRVGGALSGIAEAGSQCSNE